MIQRTSTGDLRRMYKAFGVVMYEVGIAEVLYLTCVCICGLYRLLSPHRPSHCLCHRYVIS
jgi:hypothetical protein